MALLLKSEELLYQFQPILLKAADAKEKRIEALCKHGTWVTRDWLIEKRLN